MGLKRCRHCKQTINEVGEIVNIDTDLEVALELSEIGSYTCILCSRPFFIKHAEVILQREMGMMKSVIKDCSVSFGNVGDTVLIPTKKE